MTVVTRKNKRSYNPDGAIDQLDIAGELRILPGGAIIGPNPSGAFDYFVDGNISGETGAEDRAAYDATVDGRSWPNAFSLLSSAIAASNTSIGSSDNRYWARRNRIFACGDQELDEDLTVLPEKCDIIGAGTDLLPFPRILGNHVIAAATVGVRLINLGFITQTTADLFVFPASCHGLQILGCLFQPGATSTKCLEITDSAHVRLIGNSIIVRAGSMASIFGVGISIEGDASIHDTIIEDNNITATIGVVIVESGAAAMGGLIKDNTIRAVGLCLNDASGDFQVVGNDFISDAADDGTGTGGSALAVKCNVLLALNNRLASSDHRNVPYPIEGSLG